MTIFCEMENYNNDLFDVFEMKIPIDKLHNLMFFHLFCNPYDDEYLINLVLCHNMDKRLKVVL